MALGRHVPVNSGRSGRLDRCGSSGALLSLTSAGENTAGFVLRLMHIDLSNHVREL